MGKTAGSALRLMRNEHRARILTDRYRLRRARINCCLVMPERPLCGVPLIERKQLLARLLAPQPGQGVLRYSDHIAGQGPDVAAHACRRALEGVISKRADSRYEQRRTSTWLKVKCLQRQEFVIGGWTDPSGAR
jgi:ATP-dependent DNA ligase